MRLDVQVYGGKIQPSPSHSASKRCPGAGNTLPALKSNRLLTQLGVWGLVCHMTQLRNRTWATVVERSRRWATSLFALTIAVPPPQIRERTRQSGIDGNPSLRAMDPPPGGAPGADASAEGERGMEKGKQVGSCREKVLN